jgi:hypothetical protein
VTAEARTIEKIDRALKEAERIEANGRARKKG